MRFTEGVDQSALGKISDAVCALGSGCKEEGMLLLCGYSCRHCLRDPGLQCRFPLTEPVIVLQDAANARRDLLAGHISQMGHIFRSLLQGLHIHQSPLSADDRQPDPTAFTERSDDLDHADLAGASDMRRTAGTEVNAGNLYKPQRSVDLLFTSVDRLLQLLRIRIPAADLFIVPDDAVGLCLQPQNVLISQRAVEIKRHCVVAEMKTDIVIAETVMGQPGEDVLSGMILHVREAVSKIDLTAYGLSRSKGRLPVFCLFSFHAVPDHISVQLHIDDGITVDRPGIRCLSALLGKKQSPVKNDFPVTGLLLFNQLRRENGRRKVRGICVAVKQFYGFRECKHKVKAALYSYYKKSQNYK